MLRSILVLSFLAIALIEARGGHRGDNGQRGDRPPRGPGGHRNPGQGSGPSSSRRTCYGLLRLEIPRDDIVTECADEHDIELPTGNRERPRRSPRRGHKRPEGPSALSEEFLTCIDDGIFEHLDVITDGEIDSAALATVIGDAMTANAQSNTDLTISDSQVTSIKDGVPDCVENVDDETVKFRALMRCVTEACVEELDDN